ncbi:MAG: lytic transglycosylase domain-containing protein [Pseudomonadota bacterium]
MSRQKILITLSALLFCNFAAANSDAVNARLMQQSLDAAAKEEWGDAKQLARQVSTPAAEVLIEWMALRKGIEDFARYQKFLKQHGDWPGLKRLRKRGETTIPAGTSLADIKTYFKAEPPQTATGVLRLSEALRASGQSDAADKALIDAWLTLSFSGDEEALYLARYKDLLRPHHADRVDALLWRGQSAEASRNLTNISDDLRLLAQARIALQKQDKSVDVKISAVPAALSDDPGLNFDRFQWRIKKGRWDDAQGFIAEMDTLEELGRPEDWANRRRGFARRAMRAGLHDLAYKIASNHHLTDGANYADLEWISGFIALQFKQNATLAEAHFQNMADVVRSPISVGRAYYWLGRALDAQGKSEDGQAAYATASAHQWAFYGQLAAERAGQKSDPFLAADAQVDWRSGDFLNSSVTQAAHLYHLLGDNPRVRWFLAHMAETLSVEETAKLSHYARDLGATYAALGIAKEAVKRDFVLPDVYFPVTQLADNAGQLPPELALAIARRESEFRFNAESGAGALGLMQVMPATGKQVAGELGIDFSTTKLRDDWRFNARLGTHYLAGLLDDFGGSYVLAIAAYNAGPSRVNQWIRDYGDPRRGSVDVIDWIEHIPFRETRNYVMRVMEALHVYRARFGKDDGKVALTRDLSRG